MCLLSTIDGEIIKQMFYVSRLKRCLLRLPNGIFVRNINNYKLEMIRLRNKDILQQETHVPDSSQTSVKTVLHVHRDEFTHISHDTDTSNIWCQSPLIFQMTSLDRSNDLLHLYHAHASMLTHTDALNDTVFSPDESLQGSSNSFTVSKCWFKFGNLQIFCYYSNHKPSTGLWETIPRRLEDDFITSISALKLRITSSRQKYVSQLFEYLWDINTLISMDMMYSI